MKLETIRLQLVIIFPIVVRSYAQVIVMFAPLVGFIFSACVVVLILEPVRSKHFNRIAIAHARLDDLTRDGRQWKNLL